MRTSFKYPTSLNNRTCSHGGDGAEEDSDWVSPADGVAVLLEVGGEGLVVQRLDYVHPRVVEGLVFRKKEDIIYGKPKHQLSMRNIITAPSYLDALPDVSALFVVVRRHLGEHQGKKER